MNAARIAELLRELADELEDADDKDPPAREPQRKKRVIVDEVSRARARRNLERRGLL